MLCVCVSIRHTFAISRRDAPELLQNFRPEGRGECRAPSAPAASCAHIGRKYAHEYSQRVRRDHPTFPHAMVYGLFRALLGDRAFLSPSLAKVAFRKLDASVEASGPHVFAVRFSAVRYRHLHVHRIPPRVRDDREPPLRWDGTAVICEVIWVRREEEIFLTMGMDRH